MKHLWKQTKAGVADNWRVWLLVGAVVASVVLALTYQLGSLTGQASATEQQIVGRVTDNSIAITDVFKNAVYLPYQLAVYLMQFTPLDSLGAVRAISGAFGLLGLAGFFYVLSKWYTLRIAVLGTLLFASSSWFLHTARFADPAASYLLVPLLIAGVVALQSKTRPRWMLLLITLLGLSVAYVPGLLWFLVPAIVLQRRIILDNLSLQPLWFKSTVAIMTIIMLVPLGFTVFFASELGSTNSLLSLLGIPSSFETLDDFFKTGAITISNMFAYSKAGPLYSAGHLPWLDAAASLLVAIGLYQFVRHFRLDRTKLLILVGVNGLVLIALGGSVAPVLLLPFVYLLAVEGLKWLLDSWLQVFPRNPVARSFGITLTVMVVCIIATYQTQKYFLAWGGSPETHAVFNQTE